MEIRDPIHGDIDIDKLAQELLDTAAMQRLRGIKQLGFTYLVYPGCVHTRFDHSLGTYHMAKVLYDKVVTQPDKLDRLALGAAALLHDVGHIPFGHTLEDEYALYSRHDSKERLLQVLRLPEVSDILEGQGVCKLVSQILLKELPHKKRYLSELVSSTIDADVLDYLKRDAYFAGLVHNYDDRVLNNFMIVDGGLVYRLVNKGMERSDARSELVHLLRLRYYLTERLYYHHAKISAGVMIAKAVERAQISEQELTTISDELLLYRCSVQSEVLADTELQRLVLRLRTRQLYKRAFVAASDEGLLSHWYNRKALEVNIAKAAGIAESEVGIYVGPLDVFKEAEVPVLRRSGIKPLYLGDEADVAALNEQYRRLTRFYVFTPTEYVAKVQPIVETMLGKPSEYQRDLISL